MAKEFEGQFECLGENIEKYITFPVPIKTKLENDKRITYKTKFTDGFIFMSSSLSSLADNLFGGLRNRYSTNTWITGKDLMKRHYLIKKIFTVIKRLKNYKC